MCRTAAARKISYQLTCSNLTPSSTKNESTFKKHKKGTGDFVWLDVIDTVFLKEGILPE